MRTTYDTSKMMVDFTQMKSFGQDPLILDRGDGIRVVDVFGKSYIDGLSGVFTANLGHGVTELVDVAAELHCRIKARLCVALPQFEGIFQRVLDLQDGPADILIEALLGAGRERIYIETERLGLVDPIGHPQSSINSHEQSQGVVSALHPGC